MKTAFLILALTLLPASGCDGQSRTDTGTVIVRPSPSGGPVGGRCDDCELMYVGLPEVVGPVDTSEGWNEEGQKLLVTGKVFRTDGKTPAAGVIVYYWQTDARGYYSPRDGMAPAARRHGHIRGWVKSAADGGFSVYTIRPAPYPGTANPAHIHLLVREPDLANEYYTDELVFDDDPLLTGTIRRSHQNRGGSGVLRVRVSEHLQIAEHNIILGLNVPDYPTPSGPGK